MVHETNATPDGWPDDLDLRGVTESVVTTLGPNGRWNVAALGLFAPEEGGESREASEPVTARTWGRTRTWRNFRERGEGYVQFTRDPVDFVDAACSIREIDDAVLESADAWVRVEVERSDEGEEAGSRWVDWRLYPVETAVERRVVSVTNRGYNAVVDATVAASRLGVPGYDEAELRDRLAYLEDVVERCGGDRERAALGRLREHADLPS